MQPYHTRVPENPVGRLLLDFCMTFGRLYQTFTRLHLTFHFYRASQVLTGHSESCAPCAVCHKQVPCAPLPVHTVGEGNHVANLYEQVLEFSFPRRDDSMVNIFKLVVSALVLAKVPLRLVDVAKIVSEQESRVTFILDRLSS